MRGELAAEVEAEVLRLARDGEATAVIAKLCGVGETTVRRLRQEHGIPTPPPRATPASARPSVSGRQPPAVCPDCKHHVLWLTGTDGVRRMYNRELHTFAVRDPVTGAFAEHQGNRRHGETCGRAPASPPARAGGT